MRQKAVIAAVALLAIGSALWAQSPSQFPSVEVYRSPTCGCCAKWIAHLSQHGFTVNTTDVPDMSPIKKQHQVPSAVASCHTALVGGYVVEGHVPATDVQRLLQERPAVAGVAVPGMPIGSPGMEVEGSRSEAYDVVAFNAEGPIRVFASHPRRTAQ